MKLKEKNKLKGYRCFVSLTKKICRVTLLIKAEHGPFVLIGCVKNMRKGGGVAY